VTDDIAARWAAVRARVDAAARRAGRDPADVTVVAVSKTHPAAAAVAAVAAGAVDLGENYAQELVAKAAEVAALTSAPVRWHFIGRLQRNKAKLVAGKVALVHAVDSVELGVELGKRAAAIGAVQPVLIAVNVAGEATKSGVAADEVEAIVDALRGAAGVRVDGLMTMPPPVEDPEVVRPHFRALRALRDRLGLAALSMGMTGDFEVAIAEGATLVRIGTAIFGSRPPAAA
jgi:pyridoxal phosphate enzyme (YggS family)